VPLGAAGRVAAVRRPIEAELVESDLVAPTAETGLFFDPSLCVLCLFMSRAASVRQARVP
jgi:hypothetical protein